VRDCTDQQDRHNYRNNASRILRNHTKLLEWSGNLYWQQSLSHECTFMVKTGYALAVSDATRS
jgi:hypothetical protein